MRQFTLFALLGALLLLGASPALAQQEDVEAVDTEGGEGGEEGAEGKADEEECEEAWDYVEFMKASIKDKIETILQDTLFQPTSLLDQTVTATMEKVLEIREDILTRTKSIRTGDGEVIICEEQNIKQEEFLTSVRTQLMDILFDLIDKDAATPERLQEVGKQLLAIRTKVNVEITRMLMLRESSGTVRSSSKKDDCDCGILDEVFEGLEAVINAGKEGEAEEVVEEGDADDAEVREGGEGEEGAAGSEDPVQQLTMLLMSVDAEIKSLYNQILGELDDDARAKLSEDLQDLKGISIDLHETLSKLASLDPEEEAEAVERVRRRDVRSVRNDVKRLLDICQQNCPGECDSCGAAKIDEVAEKLFEYRATIEGLAEEEAKESIRSDLMGFLTQTNTEMTELLKEKAETGELDECGTEQLEVIDKIKGPLWMMVNITIFGDAPTMGEMITALEQALVEMRAQYCGPEDGGPEKLEDRKDDDDECDLNEINTARNWIADIDEIIAEDIFKNEDDEGRRSAMLKLIELKSTMDDRVRELFQENLQCKEEVEQIKNIYASKLTECLAEMMNPRFRFDLLGRADRVQCTKDMRILIEDRRGELLMREIENRIGDSGVEEAA